MADILILEDDIEFASDLQTLLESHGHTIVWCRTATEASAVLAELDIDLVIADIFIKQGGKYVPDGGIRLIGSMRNPGITSRHRKLAKMPVIAMSGASLDPGNPHVLNNATSVGATYTLKKPIVPKVLLETVATALGKSAAATG